MSQPKNWNKIKRSNICVIGVPDKEERENNKNIKVLEGTIAEIFLK